MSPGVSSNGIYFSLVSSFYAAEFEKAIILLDSTHDKYLSLIDQAAVYLKIITQNAFVCDESGNYHAQADQYDAEQLNYWITYFQENHFIMQSHQPNQNHIAQSPIKLGGLCDYQWDLKPSWDPFKSASKLQIFSALIKLVQVHWIIKRKGIKGLLEIIKKTSAKYHPSVHPSTDAIQGLAMIVDAATLFYPKKTFCLAWATTFVLLALKKNMQVSLAIGIQANPFYAHAWAQTHHGEVIHDDPQVGQVLSKIVTTPHF